MPTGCCDSDHQGVNYLHFHLSLFFPYDTCFSFMDIMSSGILLMNFLTFSFEETPFSESPVSRSPPFAPQYFFHRPHFGFFLLLILKQSIICSDLVLDKKKQKNTGGITLLLSTCPREASSELQGDPQEGLGGVSPHPHRLGLGFFETAHYTETSQEPRSESLASQHLTRWPPAGCTSRDSPRFPAQFSSGTQDSLHASVIEIYPRWWKCQKLNQL